MGKWLASRVSWRSVAAAAPLFVVALLFALQLRPKDEIERAIMFEMQIVLLFPLVVGPIRARPRSWVGQVVRWGALVAVIALFLGRSAFEVGGWPGVGTMLALMLATYSGALLDPDAERALEKTMSRWIVGAVAVFGSCAASAVLAGANTPLQNVWWGAFCFVILGLGELVSVAGGAPSPPDPVIARRERHAQRLRAFARRS